MSSTTLGVKVDPVLRTRIREAADRIGRTQHWFIKQSIYAMLEEIEQGLPQALQQALAEESVCLSELEEAGLIPGHAEAQPFLDFAQQLRLNLSYALLSQAPIEAPRPNACLCYLPSPIGEHKAAIQTTARQLVEALRHKRQSAVAWMP